MRELYVKSMFMDKSEIKAGTFMTKTAYPVTIVKSRGPIKYGEPQKPRFHEISAQLDAAKTRLEEIVRAVRAAKRR